MPLMIIGYSAFSIKKKTKHAKEYIASLAAACDAFRSFLNRNKEKAMFIWPDEYAM